MNDSLTPFDIPLIVRLIADYLDKTDYINCCLVNKTFCSLFQPYLWRDISIGTEYRSLSPYKLTPSYRKAILKNGHHIRKLIMFEENPGDLLKFLASDVSPCQHLLELTHHAEMFSHLNSHICLADFVRRNTQLQKLDVEFEEDEEEVALCFSLIDVISDHPSLKELRVSITTYESCNFDYQDDLLQRLPKTLQVLELDMTINEEFQFEEEEEEESEEDDYDDSDDVVDSRTLGTYPELKSVTVAALFDKQQAATILPFIRGCTALEKLHIDNLSKPVNYIFLEHLGNSGILRHLKDVHIGHADFNESESQRLVDIMQGRIRLFSIKASGNFPMSVFMKALAALWSDTLEVLSICHDSTYNHMDGLLSKDIEVILSSCPKLRIFSYSNNEVPFSGRHYFPVGLKIWSKNERYSNESTWVCLELESLEILFLDTFVDDIKEPISDGIESVYKKLGRLTKLRRLAIGWSSIRDVKRPEEKLNFSLKSGLKHLKDLKSLRILDVSNIKEVGIGQEEVEWIAEFWPSLREIRVAMILHVANYNATARYEYNTHNFTKAIGKNAVYVYAVYLVLSALVRDHFIHLAVGPDAGTLVFFPATFATVVGASCFVLGILLNLWTLKSLGIKGMYNGDSFGFLFDAPVEDGPYKYFSDPQYVGTTLSLFGTAVYYQSAIGYILAIDMYIIFWISVMFFEGPHMRRIYSQKKKAE
ncbi:hypothetical protein BGZ49_002001 [Haplosporangium sp. Z 27]|nr:hypothetical protein BGZ49_002001 [Haplosporangium sp. Z 27]